MEERVRTGGCLCGAVRYSVRGEPLHVRRCHCTSCRKESGSAFTVYAHWPVDAFELSGELAGYDGRGFCARCGSRLLDTAEPDSTLVEIRLGSLDDAPFELIPADETWVKRRESWIPPVDGAAQHEESRDARRPLTAMEEQVVPVLRVAKADRAVAWYARLGFREEWRHQFEPGFPWFVSVARGPMRIYLSEHAGDARPDTLLHLYVNDVDDVATEFGVTVDEEGLAGRECALTDPDGNRLRVATRRT